MIFIFIISTAAHINFFDSFIDGSADPVIQQLFHFDRFLDGFRKYLQIHQVKFFFSFFHNEPYDRKAWGVSQTACSPPVSLFYKLK